MKYFSVFALMGLFFSGLLIGGADARKYDNDVIVIGGQGGFGGMGGGGGTPSKFQFQLAKFCIY